MTELDYGDGAASQRMSRNEIRRRTLDVGRDYIGKMGLTIGFDGLRMDDVIRDAGVSRSSAYRIWESKETFIVDLLTEVAEHSSRNLVDSGTTAVSLDIVRSHPELHGSAEGRQRLAHEMIRVGLERNYYAVVDSVDWQSFVSLSASLLGSRTESVRERIAEALAVGGDAFISGMADFHRVMSSVLGFRLRNEFSGGFHVYSVLGSSIVEGLAIRHLSNPGVTDNFYLGIATITDEREEWSPAAVAMLGLFTQFLEPDPEFDAASMPDLLERATARFG